ncbi:MAG: hypothetical protein JSS86_15105 [Cyanobacteria bacterium SZAS LIN-2]|nr:hypothetical protein [Cyanobacteria bacterium SZAS LIN-2]
MKILNRHYAVLGICLFSLSSAQPLWAQGLGEFTGLNAGVMGLGAGLAARDKGRMLKQGAAYVQDSLAAQNKAISDCLQLDKQFELKKDWENAERCLTTALQYIAQRDGPGSVKSVPVLSRLVKVEEEQDKIQQAIGYQKTVLIFNKAGKVPKPDVTHESLVLSNLYVKNSDFARAEPVLRESITLEKPKPVKSPDYKKSLRVFGSVLRENKKLDEAATVEAELVAIESAPGNEAETKAAETKTAETTTAGATPAAAPVSPSTAVITPGALPAGIPMPMPAAAPVASPETPAPVETSAAPVAPAGADTPAAASATPSATPAATDSPPATPAAPVAATDSQPATPSAEPAPESKTVTTPP